MKKWYNFIIVNKNYGLKHDCDFNFFLNSVTLGWELAHHYISQWELNVNRRYWLLSPHKLGRFEEAADFFSNKWVTISLPSGAIRAIPPVQL